MSFIPVAIGAALIGGAASVGTALINKSAAKAAAKQSQPMPLPTAQVRANGQVADVLSGRRGSRANMRTGARGAEAPRFGGKTKMGQ